MASWLTPFLPCSVYSDATAQAPLPAIRPGVALSSAAKRRASAGAGPRGSGGRGCLRGRDAAPHETPSAPSTPSRQWRKSSTHRPPPSTSPAAAAPPTSPPPPPGAAAERVVTMTTRAATATATRRWCSPPLPLGRRRLVPDRRPAAASTMHPRPIRARRRAPPPLRRRRGGVAEGARFGRQGQAAEAQTPPSEVAAQRLLKI
ncbi:unnamed protein product [Urochloa humidicola]